MQTFLPPGETRRLHGNRDGRRYRFDPRVAVSKGMSCNGIEIVAFNRDGKYPSYHFPLLVEL